MPDQPYSHAVPTISAGPANRHMIGTLALMEAKKKVHVLLAESMNAEDSANFSKMQEIKEEIEELKAHLDILNIAHDSHADVVAAKEGSLVQTDDEEFTSSFAQERAEASSSDDDEE